MTIKIMTIKIMTIKMIMTVTMIMTMIEICNSSRIKRTYWALTHNA